MDDAGEHLPYLRPIFQGAKSWNPTRRMEGELEGRVHRMDLNECPYPPSPRVLAAIRDSAELVNRYADGRCPRLTERIADAAGMDFDNIVWGTGSSELLGNIIRICIGPGDRLVAPTPVWRRFAGIFSAAEAEVAQVPVRDDGANDVEAAIAAATPGTRLVLAVNPNNPTGAMLSEADLIRLAEGLPAEVLLFLDEAYSDFARYAGGPDGVQILKAHRPGAWVVTRTFSKAYALAGLRLGYALCGNLAIAEALRSIGGSFNVSGVAEEAALAALDDSDYATKIQEDTKRERERICDGFRALGIEPMESVTNFISAPMPIPAAEVQAKMRERAIRVGTWSEPGFEHMLRVSVGNPDDTDAFLAALMEILGEKG